MACGEGEQRLGTGPSGSRRNVSPNDPRGAVDSVGMADPISDEPFSLTNELARERNREAADRTLLAWVRTSLAMISLGFGIERLGQAALNLDGPLVGFSPLKTRVFGAALILLGIAATLAGMWEHRHMLKAIQDADYRYQDRPPIARFMGVALVLVGLAALTVIFLF
jgi:putative membrane protein